MADVVSNFPAVLSNDDNGDSSDQYVAAKAAVGESALIRAGQSSHEARDGVRDTWATTMGSVKEIMENRFQTERSIRDLEYRQLASMNEIKAQLAGQKEFMYAQALTAAQAGLAHEREDRRFGELGALLKTIIDKLPA